MTLSRRTAALAALLLLDWTRAYAEEPNPESAPTTDRARPNCLQGFGWGQRFRNEGELLAAKQYFARCAESDCRGVVQRKCSAWLQEVERDIPTIVVSLTGVEPTRLPGARLFVDGELAPAGLSGRATAVDPGVRGLRVKLGDGSEIRARIGVPVGVKQYVVHMRAEPPRKPHAKRSKPPPPAPLPDTQASWRVMSYVSFGIAGAALTAGTVTGALAIDKRRAIERDCNTFGLHPSQTKCTPEESQAERRLTHAAIGCLVASGASAVVGLIPFIVRAASANERSTVAIGPASIDYRIEF